MKEFYRYNIENAGDEFPIPKIVEIVYHGVKETPKGWWIMSDSGNVLRRNYKGEGVYKKWIPKESKSRFAYPTRVEAMFNLLKRTQRRRLYAMTRVKFCDEAIKLIKERISI